MAQIVEVQTKLTSFFEKNLGSSEYASLMNEPSVQKYLDTGERVPFESIVPLIPSSNQIELFNLDEKDRYLSAIRAITAETDYDEIVESTTFLMQIWKASFQIALSDIRKFLGRDARSAVNRVGNRIDILGMTSAWAATSLSFFTEDFDDHLIPLCLDESAPVEERKAAIERVLNKADGQQQISDNIAALLDNLIVDFLAAVGEHAAPGSLTAQPKATPYNVERLLTPDVSSASWPLQMATSFWGSTSTRLKISGLLAIGTEEAKSISLILSVAENARQKMYKPTGDYNFEEAFDLIDGYMRHLRRFWRFRSTDYHNIYRWLEDGAVLVDAPEVLLLYLNEANHIYKEVAMYFRGYHRGQGVFADQGMPIDKDGQALSNERIMEELQKI
ncbi:hypothetical protein ETB97_007650 [Aspergillus alliaceus]|uniref:Uncharacterized protein n=1 Tax=Petromyces alliaceus TaxID=209559 RepID=A0A8H5ZYQ8_PETAA|nr:hypothetical protein ETB97_007650 [Aspergillus burnettii]